jgi:phosphoribosylaminoimidazole (AIR) synthetase
MGAGMVIVCARENVAAITSQLDQWYEIGEVVEGNQTVSIE